MKKISILFCVLLSCLFLSAAEANAYYRVTSDVLNARRNPSKSAVKVKQYTRHHTLYITTFSKDGKWGYVPKDKAWVHMAYVQQLNQEELQAYKNYLERAGITPEAPIVVNTTHPRGSKPLRMLFGVLLAFVLLCSLGMFFRDEPLHSFGVWYATAILSAAVIVVMSYAQPVLCWGLKIIGWIDHYILFGWWVDNFTSGILSVIPFVLDLPTYGLYGLLGGLLPAMAFYGIAYMFRDDYPFVKWLVYVFQIVMLIAILSIESTTWYSLFNPLLHFDHVSAISSLIKACNWGPHVNSIFKCMFYLGTFVLIVPHNVCVKFIERFQ